MNNRFANKVALVTGAAQGIGRRVCERLLDEGAQVIAVDRSELVFELQGEGVLALTADLEQYADCVRVMAAAVDTFGRLDVLVNNVGGTIWAKPYEHYQAEEIEAEVRRSLFPTLWCCHAALPYMLEQGPRGDCECFFNRYPQRQPRTLRRGQGGRECTHGLPGIRECPARNSRQCHRTWRH